MSARRRVPWQGMFVAAALAMCAGVPTYLWPVLDPFPDPAIFEAQAGASAGFKIHGQPSAKLTDAGASWFAETLASCSVVHDPTARIQGCRDARRIDTAEDLRVHYTRPGGRSVAVAFQGPLARVEALNRGFAYCDGHTLLRCDPAVDWGARLLEHVEHVEPKEPEPMRKDDSGASLLSHLQMLEAIVGLTDDRGLRTVLAAVLGAGAERVWFLVDAERAAVGFRAEGSGEQLARVIADALASAADPETSELFWKWSNFGHHERVGIELLVGEGPWVRGDVHLEKVAVDVALARVGVPRWNRERVGVPARSFLGVWRGPLGSGAILSRDHTPGGGTVILDEVEAIAAANSDPEKRRRREVKLSSRKGLPDLQLVDALTAAGVTHHGQRLGKVHAELGVSGATAIRTLPTEPERHVLEYRVR